MVVNGSETHCNWLYMTSHCITHHTSHITHHTSHIAHHTSHITHHTSMQIRSDHYRGVWKPKSWGNMPLRLLMASFKNSHTHRSALHLTTIPHSEQAYLGIVSMVRSMCELLLNGIL